MNRRNFLKNIGKGAAGAAVIATVGSEVVEALSATPAYEDEQYAYYWYNAQEAKARQRWNYGMVFEGGEYEAKNELEQEFLSSHPQLVRNKYEVTGGDMSEVVWIKVKKG